MNTSGSFLFSETSMTIKRLWKSTWVAARPMPGAAYMVSNMSSTSFANAGVEHLDRLGLGAQTGVRVLEDLQARHEVPLDCC